MTAEKTSFWACSFLFSRKKGCSMSTFFFPFLPAHNFCWNRLFQIVLKEECKTFFSGWWGQALNKGVRLWIKPKYWNRLFSKFCMRRRVQSLLQMNFYFLREAIFESIFKALGEKSPFRMNARPVPLQPKMKNRVGSNSIRAFFSCWHPFGWEREREGASLNSWCLAKIYHHRLATTLDHRHTASRVVGARMYDK